MGLFFCCLGLEFNPVQQPQLNEKVLKDKRKKLRETFERILRLYEKENPDIYKELRKLEVEYEQKRSQLSQYFDAVKVMLAVVQACICGSVYSLRIRFNSYEGRELYKTPIMCPILSTYINFHSISTYSISVRTAWALSGLHLSPI